MSYRAIIYATIMQLSCTDDADHPTTNNTEQIPWLIVVNQQEWLNTASHCIGCSENVFQPFDKIRQCMPGEHANNKDDCYRERLAPGTKAVTERELKLG